MGIKLRLIWRKVSCVLFHLKFCLGFMILAQFEKPTWADNMSRNMGHFGGRIIAASQIVWWSDYRQSKGGPQM